MHNRTVAVAAFASAAVFSVMWMYNLLPGSPMPGAIALGLCVAVAANIAEKLIEQSGTNKISSLQRFIMFLVLAAAIPFFHYYWPDLPGNQAAMEKDTLMFWIWSSTVWGVGFMLTYVIARGNHFADIAPTGLRSACISIMVFLSAAIVALAYLLFMNLSEEREVDIRGYVVIFGGMCCVPVFVKMGMFRFER